jgi:hypothetical protein
MNIGRDGTIVDQIAAAVKVDAFQKREDAAHSGAYNDGGSQNLLDKLRIWVDGINNVIPLEFRKYAKQIERDKDQNYQLYLTLKAQYEKDENDAT